VFAERQPKCKKVRQTLLIFWIQIRMRNLRLWIRIHKDPKLLAGSGYGSVTCGCGFGSGSETGDAPYQKSLKNHQKISNLINRTLKKVYLVEATCVNARADMIKNMLNN
jgi:hypothetical protein